MSYSISATTETSVTLRVTPVSGFSYYRLIYRLSSATDYDYVDVGPYTSVFTYTIRGLNAGTRYTFNVAYATTKAALNSSSAYMGAQTATTDVPEAPTPSISSLSASQGNDLEIDVSARITNADSSYTYYIDVYDDATGKWWEKESGRVSSRISTTVSVDKAGTYDVRLSIYDGNTRLDYDTVWNVVVEITLPYLSSFTVTQVSNTTAVYVNYRIGDYASGAEAVLYARQGTSGSWVYKGTYTSRSLTDERIAVNTVGTYQFRLELNYDGNFVEKLERTITISIEKPSNWSWTTAEQNAFNNKGVITALTRTRWNAFLDWLITVIAYANNAYNAGYDTILSANKMGTDKILYASAFNNIHAKVRQLGATGIPSTVYKGGIIYGSYFTSLASTANSYLNTH